MTSQKVNSLIGCLLGTAVGDALGLPCEGLSKHRLRRLYPHLDKHHFFFGKGMVSDDTEHACMVAQSLIVSAGDVRIFQNQLAWRLRWWLLGLPAGIGFATLRAIVKLWAGFPSHNSGVFSAGNGPAMRSAIIGVYCGNNLAKLREFVRASTRLTHTDPKAEYGALAVAIASHLSSERSRGSPQDYYNILQALLDSEAREFLLLVKQACEAADTLTTEEFAAQMGLSQGVSGYIYHTVPVAIHAWLRHQQDYAAAILEIIRCGGDTDTTAAIVGGIVGARVEKSGIPPAWLDNLWEYPRSVNWMEALAERLAEVGESEIKQSALPLPVYLIGLRNICFLFIVLLHGFRRLLPPY